ncbi:MAG TPA: hypothetical protein PK481_10420, partial [Bacillota bacterium]|nr:hypothetical protein [Bacillota bacterium]
MYLNENIEKLKLKFPGIMWDMLLLQNATEGQVYIEPSQKGADTLKVYINGTDIYMHSKYDPLSEAKRIAESFEPKSENQHLLFYGIGLGYVLDIMKKRDPGMVYSIYEPNPLIFLKFLSSRKLSREFVGALKSIYIKGLSLDEELELSVFFQNLGFHVRPITLPSYERVYAEDYNHF